MNISLKLFIFFILFTYSCSNETSGHYHLHSERSKKPEYVKIAYGSLESGHETNLPWPFPVDSIAHNIGSYQRYPGVLPYFHHGLDIRQKAGTPVRSTTASSVVNIENYILGKELYWEVALLDSKGFIWQYHHIDKSSIPKQIYEALESKKLIPAGTVLGTIVKWPKVSFGERFDHIHLNIIDKDADYVNPLLFMKSLEDESSPVIEGISIVEKNPIKKSPIEEMRDAIRREESGKTDAEVLVASGEYTIGVKVYDFINHEKFKVPPYKLSYRIDDGEEITFWKFDKIPGGSDIKAYPNRFYVSDKTCGSYYCRKMMMNLEFSLDSADVRFPKDVGTHKIELNAMDFHRNSSSRTFSFEIVSDSKK